MTFAASPRLVGSLLALVAHDLRNPLSALHSNVGFLSSTLGLKDAEAGDALLDVSASCSSLKHIIDNLELLGLAMLDDLPVLERTPVSMYEAAADAVRRLTPIADSYGAKLLLDAGSDRGPRGVAQREMLGRTLGNLIFNSIQNGGTTVPVRVTLGKIDGAAVITITDGGPALPESLRTSAFTAEGQLACKGDARGRYSRGLGLLAASMAAELAGIRIRSLPGPSGENAFEVIVPEV